MESNDEASSMLRVLSSDLIRRICAELDSAARLCFRLTSATCAAHVQSLGGETGTIARGDFLCSATLTAYALKEVRNFVLPPVVEGMRLRLPDSRMLELAAAQGSIAALEHLCVALSSEPDRQTCIAAARHGHLHVLRWAEQRCCLPDWEAAAASAGGGHLSALAWTLDHQTKGSVPFDCTTAGWAICAAAAAGGHLLVLQWLREERRCSWDWRTCASAAGGGHEDVLRWALRNNAPCTSGAAAAAAQGGHLGALQLVVQEGCPWDRTHCLALARALPESGARDETLSWLSSDDAEIIF